MQKKLVVISIDAMGAEDLVGDLSMTPTLESFKAEGTHVQEVEPIYPSLTYPSHTSIVTGVYPKSHGIINNTKLQPEATSPDWFWYRKDVQVPTLYDVAHEQGLKTAAFLWPVTAKSKVDYNIAEIFPNRIWNNQVLVSLQASSPLFLFEMNRKFGKLRQGIKQPFLDDFVTACAVETLKSKQPDLTLIHLVDMDSQRHAHGVRSTEAQDAFLRQDKRVKAIIDATKEAGTYDQTVFAILGDHYQIDVSKMIRLNHEFASRGWQEAGKLGTTKRGWQVFAKSCDGSTYIYCNRDSPVATKDIRDVIESVEGVEVIYTTEEVKAQGGASNCTFMVEAKRGYYFNDESQGPTIEMVEDDEIGLPNRYKAVHGFSPKKENYQTTIMFKGPGIKAGHTILSAKLVDEGPTFAKILELTRFPRAVDGNVIMDIFK
ncbi:ectonucleotide pyrophosphatase/phosphodiesterase [uncultured Vagococcus sp.]|uniref:alkaline phosphatase family protein n=1 Tax=uncultured Vagococcus sp. TaxID=189676 RepID=UPI0028D35A84|nr:ectonucleotide pyrophosphatase/phosphodiesterase [uncultured Vagococcus sp.]